MELHVIQPLMHYLHHHEHQAGLIIAIITFVESLAVIGSFIPGTLTLGTAGTFIGAGTIPAASTILYITLGAFLGDLLSYGIGHVLKERITTIWPFKRYPKLLARSRQYCEKHGRLSIFIGRFTGPMRSFVPMITGMMHMPPQRFICASLPASLAWVIAFLSPGILLGALSHEVPAKIATEFLLIGLGMILLGWFILWCITHFFEQIAQACQELNQSLWNHLNQRPLGRQCVRWMANPCEPDNPAPLMRCWIIAACMVLFATIAWCIYANTFDGAVDQAMFHLTRSLRHAYFERPMVAITLLGKSTTLLMASALITTWLLYQRQWRHAIVLIATAGVSCVLVLTCKHGFHVPRPQGIALVATSFSFPSGHTTLSMSLIGLISLWIRQALPQHLRWLPITLWCMFVTLIAFSRLYLGMHWFSDVAGGACLGLAITHTAMLLYERRPPQHIPRAGAFTTVTFLSLALAWSVYAHGHFQSTRKRTTPLYPTHPMNVQQWWHEQPMPFIPLVRDNRFGQPDHALNVQWVGRPQTIAKVLQTQGWQLHPTGMHLKAAIYRLTAKEPLPLLPKLYQNQPPALLLTFHRGQQHLILRLWHARAQLNLPNTSLWLGTLGTIHERTHVFNIHAYPPDMYTAGQLNMLANALKASPFIWKMRLIQPQRPSHDHVHWDQRLIMIVGQSMVH